MDSQLGPRRHSPFVLGYWHSLIVRTARSATIEHLTRVFHEIDLLSYRLSAYIRTLFVCHKAELCPITVL